MKYMQRSIFTYFILTHYFFCFTYLPKDYVAYAYQALGRPPIQKIFFVPDEKIKDILLGLIHNEKLFIRTAQFRISDKDIAQALIDAHKRNIKVEIIVDGDAPTEPWQKCTLLQKHGISMHKYVKSHSIMHNKFWIFGKNFHNKSLLLTGSSNATRAGTTQNQENVIITEFQPWINRCTQKFFTLWKETAKKEYDLSEQTLFHDNTVNTKEEMED